MMAGRSDATPIKLFSVDSYDLNIISFKLGNDIKFEMPRSSYLMPVVKLTFGCYSLQE